MIVSLIGSMSVGPSSAVQEAYEYSLICRWGQAMPEPRAAQLSTGLQQVAKRGLVGGPKIIKIIVIPHFVVRYL